MKASHKVLKNVFFLGTVQAVNYLIPLIIIPILLDRIGLTNYGAVSLSQGIMVLLASIVDYGFNLTGTKLISQSKNSKEEYENILKLSVAKVLLLIPCFLVLVVLTEIIPLWKEHQQIILWSYTIVIGNALFPMWYFIGKQKTATLSILNLVSRLIYLSLIILIVKNSEDYYLVNVGNGVGWIVASIVSMLLIARKHFHAIKKSQLDGNELIKLIKSNSSIFISNFMSGAYRSSGIILAGFLLSPTLLGIYGILDKVIMLIANSFVVIYNSIFPRVCFLAQRSKKLVTSFYRKLFPRIGIVVLIGSGIIMALGAVLISYMTNEVNYDEINGYMLIVSCIPIALFLNLPFSLTFISFDLKKEYFIYNTSTLLIFTFAGLLFGLQFQIRGLLIAILLTEVVVFLLGFYLLRIKKIKIL